MRRIKFTAILLSLMVLFGANMAYANTYQGNATNYNDVMWFSFQQFTPFMQVSTDSYAVGGFDPFLAVWSSGGQLLAYNDDINTVTGNWDSFIEVTPLNVFDGYISLSVFPNFPNGSIGDSYSGFAYDSLTPTALSATFWRLNIVDVAYEGQVSNPFTTPEPTTMLLISLGIVGLAGVRRFKK